jgi:superkiller protein 3
VAFGDKLGLGGPDGQFPRSNYYKLLLRRWEEANHREALRALALASKAHLLVGVKQYDEALSACAEALRLDPNLLAAPANRANAYAHLKLYEHALAIYDEVLQGHPEHDHFLMGKAAVLLRLGRNEEARSTFARAMELRWRWPMEAAT